MSGIDWVVAIFLRFENIQIKLMLVLIHPDIRIDSMYACVKIGKKQEGKREQQLRNTKEPGGDRPLWLRSTTDMQARKIKAETASSYTVIFSETESRNEFLKE